MKIDMHPSWKTILSEEFQKPYFTELLEFVDLEYASGTCYPPIENIFAAFEVPFDRVKVVIIGQDPYHGENQAHGLCFSVNPGIALPPSLKNIFAEIRTDIGTDIPKDGMLERWAEQGVLLLNATLTVREGAAGSHQRKGWEKFTDAVIQKLSDEKENLVFLLWGGYAKKKGARVDKAKHLVLETGHPSPLSANKGHWFGNNHFSRTNSYLEEKQFEPIKW